MAQVVKLKRSSVEGKVPTTSNLELGELSINTHDGRVFFEKSSSNGFEIEHIITTNSQTTGSIELVGSITASGDISSSGNLFANISDNSDTGFKTVVYNPTTGQFFRTGSYGGGGGSDNLGDHTATTDLNMDSNSILSASAVFVQGPVTASVTGSTRPSDFFPTGIGGTYTPPTFSDGEEPDVATAEINFEVNNPELPWPPTPIAGNFVNRPFIINLPDRVPGTDIKILSISASGDLDAGGSEYILDLTVADQILVPQFGGDSNTDENDTNVFVPIWQVDESNVNNINGNAALHIVNASAGTDGYFDGATVDYFSGVSSAKVFSSVTIAPVLVSSLHLRFKVEYIKVDTTINNDGDFGRGLAVGDLPHNYSTVIYNIDKEVNANDVPENIPKGLAITIGAATGSAATLNSSFIDIFSATTPLDSDSPGMVKVSSLQTIIGSEGGFGGVSWNNVSDERLKDNIIHSTKGLEEINKINLREFNFKESKDRITGFVAQELQEIIPEAVTEGGEDASINPWMVSETTLIPYLVGAIQQQQQIIEDLQNQIDALSKNIYNKE